MRSSGPAARGAGRTRTRSTSPPASPTASRWSSRRAIRPRRAPQPPPSTSEDGPISLGAADQAALETIDGIGPVTAADIIEFRDENGGISSIDELDEIPGIGPATIESLSDSLQP